jgi:hypothetical protein
MSTQLISGSLSANHQCLRRSDAVLLEIRQKAPGAYRYCSIVSAELCQRLTCLIVYLSKSSRLQNQNQNQFYFRADVKTSARKLFV